MSESIVIRFATQGLEAAQKLSKEILATAKEAAKTIKDAAARKEFLTLAKSAFNERRDQLAGLVSSDDRAQRVRARAARDLVGAPKPDPSFEQAVNRGHALFGRAQALASAVSGGSPLSAGVGAIGAAFGGPAGAVLSIVNAALGPVIARLEKQTEARLERASRLLDAQIQRALAQANSTRRYEEDVQFRRQVQEEAREIYLRRQLAGTAFEPRAARLIEV